MRIHQLPTAVANQIAAGEVIERPASVVKELLENALDAQASVISIDIGYGGLNQIKISDNGMGIVADDLPLAIAAHATSKISQLQDLYSIASMGFRGEALASIASISRLTISSKPATQQNAMTLSAIGGEAIHLSLCARNQGTTIDVRDIFFNAPVRKKFLKSERSEFQAIETIVKRFALSAPEIVIHLNHNNKPQFSLPAAHCEKTRLVRIRKLLGKPFIDQARYFDSEHAGLRLYGWISTEEYQRSQNDKQWIYVNKRMVKDKLLNHALKQAYEDLLYPGRYPACLLYLTINPEEVDVNVHPTKHEVRFQQPRLIHDFICSQIQQGLHQSKKQQSYSQPILIEDSRLQLREPKPVLEFTPKINNRADEKKEKNWIALNANFALIFLHGLAYLIDVVALQRYWLVSFLAKQSIPLDKRPLLVPVSYSIQAEKMKAYHQALNEVGIEFDLASDHSLLVRSLPVAVPHLDLKQFLAAVFNLQELSCNMLLELLTFCQSFNAQHVSEEEIANLISYLETFTSDKLHIWCKHLSIEACRDLLNA